MAVHRPVAATQEAHESEERRIPRRELWGIVDKGKGERGFWTKIGVSFQNRDGSWNLFFDYLPMSPEIKIQMRDISERAKNGDSADSDLRGDSRRGRR